MLVGSFFASAQTRRYSFFVTSRSGLRLFHRQTQCCYLVSYLLLSIYVRGLAKNFWPDINWIQSGYISYGQWPDLRGACGRPPNVPYTHQKTKSEIGNWLAPWYFCIPAPRGDVKYTVMTKIKIALIRLMYYLTLA